MSHYHKMTQYDNPSVAGLSAIGDFTGPVESFFQPVHDFS